MGCASSSDRNSASFAIERAIDDGDLEKLKKLLRDGASPEGNHDNGGSALHRCVHTKQVAMTRHLIEAGADVNFQDSYGRKPLDVAYVRNQYQPSEARRRIIGYLEAATKKLYWDQMQQELQEGKQGTMISLVAPKDLRFASVDMWQAWCIVPWSDITRLWNSSV